MQRFKSTSEAALWIWDYFYISHVPAPGDRRIWRSIENATCRIRESEVDLDRPLPSDLRLRSARRLRNAARLAIRKIAELSVKPAPWVVEELAELEALAEELIETVSDSARGVVVH